MLAMHPVRAMDAREEAWPRVSGKTDSSLALVRHLLAALPASRRRDLWTAAALIVISASAEAVTIGALIPFLALLTDLAIVERMPFGDLLLGIAPAGPARVGAAAGAFVLLAILSGLLRLASTRHVQGLAFSISRDLSTIAFGKLLRQDFGYHLTAHSGDQLARFEALNHAAFAVFLAGLQAVAATIIGLILAALLVALSPPPAIVAAAALVALYVFASLILRTRLRRNGAVLQRHTAKRIRTVQMALGGIRDILLDRSQPAFERDFATSAEAMRRAYTSNAFLALAPRVLVETTGIVLMALYAWYLAERYGGLTAAIPALGALALGAQRLLPQLQQAYNGWSQLAANRALLADVAALVTLPAEDLAELPPPLGFGRVEFESVGFAYATGPLVLDRASFAITRGERIGIAGPTGAGKSTLVDLLLGLLEPSEGRILVDGAPLAGPRRAAWQAAVAHVPQDIYLSDESLAGNIAFGVPRAEWDEQRIRAAANRAGIAVFIDSLPEGYATPAGERGVRLSGGQRQRIAIARALYKEARLLVLDEATNSLDPATEKDVLGSIDALGTAMTVVIVAHRSSALERCSRVLTLDGGRLK
jgi:ABC-type multidrug transport system fused ATPase/permease subunit